MKNTCEYCPVCVQLSCLSKPVFSTATRTHMMKQMHKMKKEFAKTSKKCTALSWTNKPHTIVSKYSAKLSIPSCTATLTVLLYSVQCLDRHLVSYRKSYNFLAEVCSFKLTDTFLLYLSTI